MTLNLRPYQQKAVDFICSNLVDRGNSLLVAATGAGKTIMISAVAKFLIQNLNCKKIFVIVGNSKVNSQNKETLKKFCGNIAISEFSGGLKSTHGNIIAMTAQTANIHYMKLPLPDAIIIDETHHARAQTYEKLLKFWSPKFVMGATATPDRGDKKSLITLFDNFYQIGAKQLIEMNYLVKPIFFNFSADTDDKDSVKKAFKKMEFLDGKIIHFCKDHIAATLLTEILTELGLSVAYLKYGGDNDLEYEKFKAKECKHLVNVNVATEGFDEPQITNVVNWCADGTRGKWIQKIGRGLRTSPGKRICKVYDGGGNIEKYSDLEYTEILPLTKIKSKGTKLRIEDLFASSSDDILEKTAVETFVSNNGIMPYSPPDGWFSIYDTDYGVVFLSCDGKYVQIKENKIEIKPESDIELSLTLRDDENNDQKTDINLWQLKQLASFPTNGLNKSEADALLNFQLWKKKQINNFS